MSDAIKALDDLYAVAVGDSTWKETDLRGWKETILAAIASPHIAESAGQAETLEGWKRLALERGEELWRLTKVREPLTEKEQDEQWPDDGYTAPPPKHAFTVNAQYTFAGPQAPRRLDIDEAGQEAGAAEPLGRMEIEVAPPAAAPGERERCQEALNLAPILDAMCEGGRVDPSEMWTQDFSPPDGDCYVLRAADLLREFVAASRAARKAG